MRRPFRLAVLLGPMLLLGLAATPQSRYAVDTQSRFWIDGTSTMGRYTCEADAVMGSGRVLPAGRSVEAEVIVPTAAFDCGNPRMNRDFVDALQAEQHPTIRFRVDRAEILDANPAPGAWVNVRATGTLRLAGVERPITLDAEGQRLPDGRVRIRGRHPLKMTDFGVEPPTGLLGLVRARDAVVARFDLVAAAR